MAENKQLNSQLAELREKLGGLESTLSNEREQAAGKLTFLENAREQLSDSFRALATDILEEKTARFTEQNKTNIGQILDPLKTKLQEFQAKVEEVYVHESGGRSALGEQVKQLTSLNQQLSDDAKKLADALRGSTKKQGNWGEIILERLLEGAGLREGQEYELRETYKRENGSRGQPDVVVNLPQTRHLVIDSKVSLTDYDQYVNAATEVASRAALVVTLPQYDVTSSSCPRKTTKTCTRSTPWTS